MSWIQLLVSDPVLRLVVLISARINHVTRVDETVAWGTVVRRQVAPRTSTESKRRPGIRSTSSHLAGEAATTAALEMSDNVSTAMVISKAWYFLNFLNAGLEKSCFFSLQMCKTYAVFVNAAWLAKLWCTETRSGYEFVLESQTGWTRPTRSINESIVWFKAAWFRCLGPSSRLLSIAWFDRIIFWEN